MFYIDLLSSREIVKALMSVDFLRTMYTKYTTVINTIVCSLLCIDG